MSYRNNLYDHYFNFINCGFFLSSTDCGFSYRGVLDVSVLCAEACCGGMGYFCIQNVCSAQVPGTMEKKSQCIHAHAISKCDCHYRGCSQAERMYFTLFTLRRILFLQLNHICYNCAFIFIYTYTSLQSHYIYPIQLNNM